jgi:hypothetical protein
LPDILIILSAGGMIDWLDPRVDDPEILKPLLASCLDDWLERHKINTTVNSPQNECAECVNPL